MALSVLIAMLLPAGVLIARAALQRNVKKPPPALAVFTDVSIISGILAEHTPYRTGDSPAPRAGRKSGFGAIAGKSPYHTTGQAWGDYDQDGWVDLYVTDQTGPNTLYRNRGNGTFEVSAVSASAALADHRSGGAVFADYDNDGWPDLYVVGFGVDRLLHNERGRGFKDVTVAAGVTKDVRGMTAAWGDYDGDSFLDLFVASYGCDKCNKMFPDKPKPDVLYHNEGDGTFKEVSGLLPSHDEPGASYVGGWFDYDRDGDVDLYITRDVIGTGFLKPNVFLRNDGPGCSGWCFTDVSRATRTNARMDSMGLGVSDYDNDGDLDMYVTNTGWTVTSLTGPAKLFRNDGGTFTDVAPKAGAAVDAIGWGTAFLDYDNDGWKDIHVAVGFEDPAYFGGRANQDRLLHARGDGTFEEGTLVAGIEQVAVDTLGSAMADFNRDGWPDLVLGHFGRRYSLLANAATWGPANHRIAVSLRGGGPVNRDAVGALVEVTASGRTQLQQVVAGASLGAGNDLTLLYGLGNATSADIKVTWPDGRVEEYPGVPADGLWQLSYGDRPKIVPLSVPNVPTTIAGLVGDARVRTGGLIVPLLTLLTSLGLGLWFFARRMGRLSLAGSSLRLLLIWSVAFQVGHLIEHFAQMGYWFAEPSQPPFITPWGREATDGFTALVANHGGRASGTELLHLAGNWIFLAGLIPAFVMSRGSPFKTRGRRALRFAFFVEGFHILEHVLLTATWFAFDRAIGVSTLFGWATLLQRPWPTTIRPWWHFVFNLVPTIAAVVAVFRFDFSRVELPVERRDDERQPIRVAPRVYATLDAITWPIALAISAAAYEALRHRRIAVGALFALAVLAMCAQLVVGSVQGLYRRRGRRSILRATVACWATTTVMLGVVCLTRKWVPLPVLLAGASIALPAILSYRTLDWLLERRRAVLKASRRPVVVAGRDAVDFVSLVSADPFSQYEPVAVLDDISGSVHGVRLVGDWPALAAEARAHGTLTVVVPVGHGEPDEALVAAAGREGLTVETVELNSRSSSRVPIKV